ncbi:hypothetical protein [Salinivibrio sp. AR640]|uniref:hypothetical protein n=1 Tax=Salinivibrio sp. AR640 TaxID=1909437 RepID=UPI000986250B|nr:hypothetical protein [Salinivibrio sp. AR640]OOE86289.1 hypothetical protein BZG75_15140 [Salinivibrio sp. AR640]
MKKLILTTILGFSLVGCGGNADGTYVAMTKGGFLKPSLPVVLTIKGDKAVDLIRFTGHASTT